MKTLWSRYPREIVAVALLVVGFVVSTQLSSYFLDPAYLLKTTSLYIEGGMLALALTFVIVCGHIDISVAANMAMTATILGVLYQKAHLPFPLAVLVALVLGTLAGTFNGVLVAKLRLPSLAVTLGTFALFRGIAQILVGEGSAGGFPDTFNSIDSRYLAGVIPLPLVLFLLLAVGHGLVLHRTYLGRRLYAIGVSDLASRYSGIPVNNTLIGVFTLAGAVSALAGVMMTSRLTVARYDMAVGLELDAITAVVLGGTDIFGGRGSIFGTVIAFFLMVIVRTGMGLRNIKAEEQLIVIGLLLLFSILIPNLLQKRRE